VYRYPEMNVTLGNSTAPVSTNIEGNSHLLKNDFPVSASSITKSQLVNPDGFVGNLSFATMQPKDTASFHPIGILREVQAVRAVAFDPSGSFLAVGTNSRAIRICNVPSLKGTSFSRQGEESAVKLDENSSLSLLDVAYERNEHHLGSVYCLAWSPKSSLIATGSNDKTLKVMRMYKEYYGSRHVLQSNSEEDLTLHGHSGTIRSVAFSHTHPNTLISGGAGDNALRVWDIESSSTNSEPILALSGHKDAIFNISTVPGDASLIVSSGADNIVRLWDLRTGSTVSKMATYDSVQGISVTKRYGTTLIATGHADHSVSVWDFSMKKRLFQMTEHRGECRSVHFSPCSRWLLSGSFDGVINITDTENHLPVHSFNDHANKVLQVMWHPTKPIFASSSADKSVCLWAPVTRH
jgi:WD40 repeat protein